MTATPIIPSALQGSGAQLTLSPGVQAGGFAFVTGMTGSLPDGTMPDTPQAQFRSAFAKIDAVLAEAGGSLANVVEMTSYHIDMATHFDLFDQVRLALMGPPHPAWTAVEVAGLRRPGALVEIRATAWLG